MAAILRVDIIGQAGICAKLIAPWRLCAAISSMNPLCNRKSVSLRDLADTSLFTADTRGVSEFFPSIVERFQAFGITPTFRRFTNDITELLMLAGANAGIGLMTSAACELCMHNVRLVPISDFTDEYNLVLCYHADNANPLLPVACEIFDGLLSV